MYRFPWGDFHSLNLGWFLQKFNKLREDWATAEAGIDGALDAEIQKAEDALTDVFAARDAAAASASAANSSALNASQSSLASMDARDQSRAARDAAQQAAGNAAASETAAGNSATAASNSAGAAATSATQAGNSATAAGNSATAAGQSATNAAASETAAGNSAAAAAASETAAGQSAEDAENAASSVEASAQQIATNASDIVALKASMLETFPLFPFMLYNINAINAETDLHGRNFKRVRNHAKVDYVSSNTTGRWYSILSSTLDYNTSDNNLYNSLTFDKATIIKTIPHLARALATLKLSFTSESPLSFSGYSNIAFLVVFNKNGENKRRINMISAPTEEVSSYTISNSRIISDIGGFAVVVYSSRSDIKIEADFSLTPYPDAETSALTLALAEETESQKTDPDIVKAINENPA